MPKVPSPKILVVDDDVRLRDLLTRYLAEQGFTCSGIAKKLGGAYGLGITYAQTMFGGHEG